MTVSDTQQTWELTKAPWSPQDAEGLYRLNDWGRGYFAVDQRGRLMVRPDTTPEREIDLLEVVEGLRERDLHTPVLIRVSDILVHRLRHLNEAFLGAIKENEYRAGYVVAYPIKVNQQRPVVEEISRFGRSFGVGLEVGSKPELLAVMALTTEQPNHLILCNGFKDDGYLEAVVLATKLGRDIVPIIENATELDILLKHAAAYNVRPRIGVRVKLASQGAGRWRESAGAKSKFGLFISEVLELLDRLKAEGMEDCLKLVHCHAGSQLHDIRSIKDAVAELAHVYAELVKLGAGLEYIDVGGGLGVDYDGSLTNEPSSMNYTLEEYAGEIVYRIGSVCDQHGVDHPTIISESGRAIAAYQSILVFDVLGRSRLDRFRDEDVAPDDIRNHPQPIHDLLGACANVDSKRLLESYHDAVEAHEQALHLFNAGCLSLEDRGLAERLFWRTCTRIRDLCKEMEDIPDDLAGLGPILSETYFCNLSVFQSLPDSWAIGQVFPVMPIHRLDERPDHKAVLADITCDSDGRIARFVTSREDTSTLDVHELRDGEPYYLAAFLVGAYQETLGDLHNLFGDTHVVHVRQHEDGGWWLEEVVRGDTAAQVLSYVQYDVSKLYPAIARDAERAVRERAITVEECRSLLKFYEAELNGYTYLESEDVL